MAKVIERVWEFCMQPDSKPTPLRRAWVPYFVLFVSLLTTLVAAYSVSRSAYTKDQLRFENAVGRIHEHIRNRLETYIALLRAGSGLFAVSGEVNREAFRSFVERLEVQQRFPGIQGIGLTVRVMPEQRDALVAEMRRQGHDAFHLYPTHERPEYHAIIYLEPLDQRNLRAIGYDMFSEPVRREAMERARDTDAPAATGRVTLVQETDEKKQAGFLIYVPVYRNGARPQFVEERREQLFGFVYSPFRADDLLHGIIMAERDSGVDFEVFDGTSASPESLLHVSDSGAGSYTPRFTSTVAMEVAGRPWTIRFRSRPDGSAIPGGSLVTFILLGGTLIGMVLYGITMSQTRARARAEQVAAELRESESLLRVSETRFRTMIEQSPLSTQIFLPDGRTIQVNHAWEELWGVTLDRLGDYNILQDQQLVEKGIMPYIQKGFAGEATAIPPILYDPEVTIPGITSHEDARRWVQAFIYPVKDEAGVVRQVVLVHEDITERHRAEEKLRYHLNLNQTITGNTTEGLCMMDAEGRLTFMNPAAEEILQWTEAELKGQVLHDLVHYKRPDGSPYPFHECPVINVMKTGEVVRNHSDLWFRKNGEPVPVLCSCAPIVAGGRVTGAVLALNDITERVKLEDELRARAEQLAEANRLKDEFLATLSHELRTPLTAILGWAKLLRSEQFDDVSTARALETIERNAQAQTQLIDDLLDVSRIITGKLRLFVQPAELGPIIEAAVESVRPAADAKGIRLDVFWQSSVGPISGDPDRLQQVIWNLLSNAIKFTPGGGRVAVRLEREGAKARVTVSDTGQGIRADFLPHVFDRFRQADGTITRRHGGLGLGLAIVNHLIELHGGNITAESPGEGQGATFTVRLPLLNAPSEIQEEELMDGNAKGGNGTAPRALLDGVRVLIVDDDSDARELLSMLLRRSGANVSAASSVSEALETLERSKPDVLVSDIGMPGEDGYELIRRVRALGAERGGNIPAAALTAYARVEDHANAIAAGYHVHISKPVEPNELTQIVARLVSGKSQ